MRVLHVVAPAAVGGLERVVQTLAAAQRSAGDDVDVAALHSGASGDLELFAAPLRLANVGVHFLDVPARAYSHERSAVAALATQLRAQVVHTHGYRTDVVDGRVAPAVGAAAVSTAHGFTGGGLRNRVYEWLQCRAWRRSDAVVAVSRPLEQRLLAAGVRRERLHLVVNAWAPSEPLLPRDAARDALGLPRDATVLGWVGRISREKGLDVLVDAFAHLAKPIPHLVVIGEGPGRATLETSLAARGLAPKVSWSGTVPNAARLFSAFDVYVLSSRTEGSPMVLFEAMSAGVPIVATRVGGIPDLVTPDEALLVTSDDSRALAAAIDLTLRDRPASQARTARAAARMREFCDIAGWAAHYRRIYETALAALPHR